jgi:hypothetical protein
MGHFFAVTIDIAEAILLVKSKRINENTSLSQKKRLFMGKSSHHIIGLLS